jgi:DNA-binding NarL/FixJ family response regulator
MPNRIVILSSHSLFIEGVASRLRQYPQRVEVRFVDPQLPDYIEQIDGIRPSAVILDAADTQTTQCCLLCELLIATPNITVVRLMVDQKDVQVIASKRQCFEGVQDLIEILLPAETSS